MKYTVNLSNKALKTYDSIKQQLQSRWGEKVVNEFDARMLNALEILTHSPMLYQATATDKSVRKCVIHKNCSMFYRIDGFQVNVLFLIDNRQEPLF
jgi:plasmid stabilization system protein ParE